MSNLRKRSVRGVAWVFAQQFSGQIFSFLVSIILARLLMPEEFGLIGMIAVVIAIGQALKDAGMPQSLIRTENPTDADYSTIFYTNLGVSFLIYVGIYAISPLISQFYNKPILTMMTRVLALGILVSAFSSIQRTRLTKDMNFKTQFIVDMPSLVVSGFVGALFAYFGYGVWSLVWMQLTKNVLSTIQLWIYAKWIPKRIFSFSLLKYHLNFGYKLTISGLLDALYSNIYNVLIGRYFSAADLGYYTRATGTTNLIVQNVSGAINKVTFPLFSEIQQDNKRLKSVYRLVMQQVIFWVAPTLVGAAILAEPVFRLVFTEKWLPAVPMFQIYCFVGIMYPVHLYNLSILNVKGRSDLFLKLEVTKKILAVTAILFVIPYGVLALLYFQLFFSLFAFSINSYYSGKLIQYNMFEQIKHILPIFGITFIMGSTCWVVDKLMVEMKQGDLSRISIGLLTGVLSYFLISKLFKSTPLSEFIKIITKK